MQIITEGGAFRTEEVSCAIELVDAALAQAEGNTYEVLVADEHEGGRGVAGDGSDVGNVGDVVDDGSDGGRRRSEPLGYACFGATPMTLGTFDLYWLVVAARARARGVGTALLRATEEQLRGRGARLIRIETSSLEGQGGAARFYARAGYEEVGRIRDFYRAGDDLITFAKRL